MVDEPKYGTLVERYCQRKTEVFGQKHILIPYPPKIPYRLTWAQTWASKLGLSLVFISKSTELKSVRVRLIPDGTRWRTGGGVKKKLANRLGSHYSHTTSERGVSSITTADAHTSAANSRLNWRPRRFKWTRPFRRKTKSGFCACTITFQTHCI